MTHPMRRLMEAVTAASAWESDPHIQFHLSVEPNLRPNATFAQQTRTNSWAGARGEAGGDGIYTTRNPGYWLAQLAYEQVGELPRYIYLVRVEHPSSGSIDAAHQDLSPPDEVTVLTKLMTVPDTDEPLDAGRLFWLANRFVGQGVVREAAAPQKRVIPIDDLPDETKVDICNWIAEHHPYFANTQDWTEVRDNLLNLADPPMARVGMMPVRQLHGTMDRDPSDNAVPESSDQVSESIEAIHRTTAAAASEIERNGFDLRKFGAGAGAGTGEPAGIFVSVGEGDDFAAENTRRNLGLNAVLRLRLDVQSVLEWDRDERIAYTKAARLEFMQSRFKLSLQDATDLARFSIRAMKAKPELFEIAKYLDTPEGERALAMFLNKKLRDDGYDAVTYRDPWQGVQQMIVLDPRRIRIISD